MSTGSPTRATRTIGFWLRIALGVLGLGGLVAIVVDVGPRAVLDTLVPALRWVPLLYGLELCRAACEALASYLAFGKLARKIPLVTLFRANLAGQAIGNIAPAPRVVNETIKATLLGPYTGIEPAVSVGFVNQAATLSSVGLFSVPCAIAIFALEGASVWFWATLAHAVVLVACGIALRAVTRSERLSNKVARRFPRFAPRIEAFRAHARGVDLLARGPTAALLLNRCFQVAQYTVAARAVGIDAGLLRSLGVQGVNLVASAVGVMVPGGFGTTDGAFTLAANMLGTTRERATSLALVIRCMQLVGLVVGLVAMFVGPRRTAAAIVDAPTETKDPSPTSA